MLKTISLTCAVVMIASCATAEEPASGNVVAIDSSNSAYTVFVSIPAEELETIRARVTAQAKVTFVPWQEFIANTPKYVASKIIKDEYPGAGAVDGIPQLLKKYPKTPFGITWNGGIALTYNDFQYAKRTYKGFSTNLEEYERSRIRDPRRDPVHPAGHLVPLLGR